MDTCQWMVEHAALCHIETTQLFCMQSKLVDWFWHSSHNILLGMEDVSSQRKVPPGCFVDNDIFYILLTHTVPVLNDIMS